MTIRHVLHLLGSAEYEGTGIARQVLAIGRELAPAGYASHAWFLTDEGPLAQELAEGGLEVRVLGWRSPVDGRGAARLALDLRRRRFDLVHQHYGARLVRLVARSSGRPVVWHVHEQARTCPLARQLERLARPAAAVAPSWSAAALAPYPETRVVYPGIQVATPRRQRHRGSTVGTASRLVAGKGIHYLLEAVALLRKDMPDVRLEIAGSGPEEDRLRADCERLGLNGCVSFLGWQPSLAEAFARWDVFAFPTLEETFGLAALEAMGAGLPVVASAAGGLPEIVVDGATGILVPPADSAALAGGILRLLGDPGERRALGRAGRARAAECFGVERMAAEIKGVYEEALGCFPPCQGG